MKIVLAIMSLLSQLYAMPVLANASNQLSTALATSAARFSYDTETNYCGGQVVSYKILKNNSQKITVSTIMTAQRKNCESVSLKKCTVTYSKGESILRETAFNCKT